MNALRKAPQRAQRVRGVPGVGLRTADGTEWVKVGKVFAEIGGVDTIRVQSCTRPGRYGNPWRVVEVDGIWLAQAGAQAGVWWANDRECPFHQSRRSAVAATIRQFRKLARLWPDAMFHDLAKFDCLSCFCPLDRPCHVDAIIAEGARRGIWGGG